ncbi:MAG: AAA family ATPase [Chloroflexi bacterium]|nr:AAA family ATPase [Chloroflexota bacterium]
MATGEHFTDRDAEIRELVSDLRSGQNVLVISPRRYGKTSMVTAVIDRIRKQHVLVAYLDLLRTTTKERFANQLAAELYAGLTPTVEQAVHRAGELFQNLPLRPKITLNEDGTPSFEFAAVPGATDIEQTIDRLLELPQQVAQRRKRQAVLVLDEFQEIVTLDPDLPARMRATFQFQPNVAHVYLGSRQHLLRRVFTDANSPLYNSAKVVPLGPIPRSAFTHFIAERFASTHVVITKEAIAHLLDLTGGHPHDTQKLGYFTWAAAESLRTPASAETVDRAFAAAIATDTAHYTDLWEGLTTNQRRLLEAIGQAHPSEAVLSEDFRRRHRLGAYATVERALDSLVERGLVEREGRSRVFVPDVFLHQWLRTSS